MIGRVLRQPHAMLTTQPSLNECYVYTFDQEVQRAVEAVRKGLQEEGMGDLAGSVRYGGDDSNAIHKNREKVLRREAFRSLPVILLPRVLHRDEEARGGYRVLDYERDILGKLDWESLHFLQVDSFQPLDSEKLTRTVARISIEKQSDDEFDFTDSLTLSEDDIPEEGLDFPFLVRQLMEIIPNPWQAARILEETLDVLRKSMEKKRIYTNRLILLQEMKKDLRLQLFGGSRGRERIDGIAEKLFRDQLQSGDIQFRLMTANNPDLYNAARKQLLNRAGKLSIGLALTPSSPSLTLTNAAITLAGLQAETISSTGVVTTN